MGLADGNPKMSMNTACPACHTEFEITEPQLQAYAGKVRCGECDHVFDARQHLLTEAVADTATTPTLAPHASDVRLEPILALNDTPEIPPFLQAVTLTEKSAPRPASPATQRIYAIAIAWLVLIAVVQCLYLTRVSLAAQFPASRPWLQALCRPLHCQVPLPQDISQLTIDDADMQEHAERQGVLVFSSVLMNHSAVTVDYPRLELTLTNMADEAIMRRIFTPAEYLPAHTAVAQGLRAQQEVPVKLLLGVDAQQVTGFRVEIAY